MIEPRIKPVVATATPTSAERWQSLFGCPAPQRLPSLVDQVIAWREQVLLHGDVSATIAHDLQLAAEHALKRRAAEQRPHASALPPEPPALATSSMPSVNDRTAPAAAEPAVRKTPVSAASGKSGALASPARRSRAALPPAASQLLPGSQLIKAHGGRNHVVAVEEDGFRYEGVLFTSLSAIAKHITGTHWNGLLFFGLRKRRSYPPKPRRHG